LKLATYLHLVPRLRMAGAIFLLPLYAFIHVDRDNFTIYVLRGCVHYDNMNLTVLYFSAENFLST